MQFKVQDVDGQPVLLAEGGIDDALIPRLQSAIDNFRGEEIWLRSRGGNSRVAREAGIILKHSGLSTRIIEGSACAGACTFLFMGGVMRTVDPGGHLMFDSSMNGSNDGTAGTSAGVTERATAREVSEIFDFLIHVGISRNLISDMLYRSQPVAGGGSRWYCPTLDELRRYNVTPVVASFQTLQAATGDEKP